MLAGAADGVGARPRGFAGLPPVVADAVRQGSSADQLGRGVHRNALVVVVSLATIAMKSLPLRETVNGDVPVAEEVGMSARCRVQLGLEDAAREGGTASDDTASDRTASTAAGEDYLLRRCRVTRVGPGRHADDGRVGHAPWPRHPEGCAMTATPAPAHPARHVVTSTTSGSPGPASSPRPSAAKSAVGEGLAAPSATQARRGRGTA